MKKKNIILIIILIVNIILLGIIIYGFILFSGTGMQFPNEPINEQHITENISQETFGEKIILKWSMDTSCKQVELLHGEKNIDQDPNSSWGGYTADCEKSDNIYNCQASIPLPPITKDAAYQAQVDAYDCENDNAITGPVYEFSNN